MQTQTEVTWIRPYPPVLDIEVRQTSRTGRIETHAEDFTHDGVRYGLIAFASQSGPPGGFSPTVDSDGDVDTFYGDWQSMVRTDKDSWIQDGRIKLTHRVAEQLSRTGSFLRYVAMSSSAITAAVDGPDIVAFAETLGLCPPKRRQDQA